MSTKTKAPVVLPAQEMLTNLEQELNEVETKLSAAMTEQQPGFSQTMLGLLEQARAVGKKISSVGSAKARQQQAMEEFDSAVEQYVVMKRQQDKIALLANQALMNVVIALSSERHFGSHAEKLMETIMGQIRRQNDDPDFAALLRAQLNGVEETLAQELEAPKQRMEIFDDGAIPDVTVHAILRLRRYFMALLSKQGITFRDEDE